MKHRKVNGFLCIVLLLGFTLYGFFWGSPFQPLSWNGSSLQAVPTCETASGVQGMGVSAAHPEAVAAGMEILRNGGNAVDAAVAVAFALGVVQPFDCGIGGGGAMLIYPGDGLLPLVYEYREVAPQSGRMTTGMVGVPGVVKGMEAVHRDYGTTEWSELLEPAIRLATDGFVVSSHFSRHLHTYRNQLSVTDLPHFYPNGQPLQAGRRLVQTELGETLQVIGNGGADAFYQGAIPRAIMAKVPQIAGSDFIACQVRITPPVRGMFYGYEILTAGPPLGGVTLIQMLQMMEMAGLGPPTETPEAYYSLLAKLISETGVVWRDSIADPDFYPVPCAELTSREYAWNLLQQARSSEVRASSDDELEDGNTTHFVVVDADGMMVSATHTISSHFGSGIYVKGFFLNNQMRNFSSESTSVNGLEAGKSPRGTIAPTILVKPGNKMIGIGAPGGSRIPMTLAQVIYNFIAMDMNLSEAMVAPRIYRLNGLMYVDRRIPTVVREDMRSSGYAVFTFQEHTFFDGVQCIVIDFEQQQMYGGSEPATDGTWQVEGLLHE